MRVRAVRLDSGAVAIVVGLVHVVGSDVQLENGVGARMRRSIDRWRRDAGACRAALVHATVMGLRVADVGTAGRSRGH
ncbi:MAG TPA: hypothetical protein VFF05_06470, partial [Rudaea sp.]|nr:hypothetical protein [Rudaea sp.]